MTVEPRGRYRITALARDYVSVLTSRQRRHAIGCVLLLLASGVAEVGALSMLVPLVNPRAVTRGHGLLASTVRSAGIRTEHRVVIIALAAFVVLGLVAALVRFLGETAILRLRISAERDMRVVLTDALLGMRWTAFHAMRLGDISKAIVAEGNNASLGLQVLLQALGNALVATAFVAAAVVLSPRLTGFTLVFAVVMALVYRRASHATDARSQELSSATSHISEESEDIFATLKYVRSSGSLATSHAGVERLFQRFADLSYRAHVVMPRMRLLFESIGVLFISAVLLASALPHAQLTASAVAFLALFYRLAPRLQQVQEQILLSRTYRSWLVTWQARLDSARAAADTKSGTTAPTFNRGLQLVDVGVVYPNGSVPALEQIDLTVRRGECLAIVGESGSGKSTLLDVITGLVTPTSGQVFVDDTPLADLDRAAWQSRIGLVLQETPIYHASIADNIAWQGEDRDPGSLARSAAAANAAGFIEALPDGYDAVVGEKGGRLSGGQRQRLALARALHRGPWMLLLDEATSALDSESEALVLDAIARLKGTCSVVIVAHRLVTTQISDRVVVLSKGRIVQEGTFETLLSEPTGPFASMAAAQGLIRAPVHDR